MSRWSWVVAAEDAGLRADKAIHEAIEDDESGEWEGEPRPLSRSQLQKLIDQGRAHRNGEGLTSSVKLVAGDRIELDLPDPEPLELMPENIPLDVLYEDEHIVVVNKQPGLTVHPSSTQRTGTLVHALLHHCGRSLSGIGGVLRPGIVHRIDKDTSGALVVTKTDAAHSALAAVFARHEIERAYSALCFGAPAWSGEHRCETLIARNPNDRLRMTTEVKEGRKAITRFRVLERYGVAAKAPYASLVEARLETGRTHQVRVHLTALNHSILGDPVYGTPSSNQPKWKALPADVQEFVRKLPGQALHARVLGFRHPVNGAELRFEAPYPSEYQRLLDRLRESA
jgi:23S rRNA pseudouridine1911/1915/1917 synthase